VRNLDHQYNIWTQYAVIEPDRIEPYLGTPGELKALIDEPYRRGLKVFLHAFAHGVLPTARWSSAIPIGSEASNALAA
jgi:hypothetical protein